MTALTQKGPTELLHQRRLVNEQPHTCSEAEEEEGSAAVGTPSW